MYSFTVLAERVPYFAFSHSLTLTKNWYFVLLNNFHKSWSIIKTRNSARPEDSKTVPESYIWPRFAWVNQRQRQSLIASIFLKLIYCLLPWLSQPNLGQMQLSGTVLESSGWADSRSVHGFDNWPRFVWVIEQNKISNSFCHHCIIAIYLLDWRLKTCQSMVVSYSYQLSVYWIEGCWHVMAW